MRFDLKAAVSNTPSADHESASRDRISDDESWVLVRAQGGLGNQLFQFANGLVESSARGSRLLVESSFLPDKFGRTFRLPAVLRGVEHISATMERYPENLLCSVVFRGRRRASPPQTAEYRCENEHPTTGTSLQQGPERNLVLHGLWQDAGVAAQAEKELRMRLRGRLLRGKAGIHPSDGDVAVHVRLGDYVTNADVRKVVANLEHTYYRNAVELVRATIGKARFTVFSDDIAGAADFACSIGAALARPPRFRSEIVDFARMRSFRHHIIANSTYSWWAAFLKRDPGMTVMPANWFVSDDDRTSALRPKDWMVVA